MRTLLIAIGACLASGVLLPSPASALPVDFDLVIEATHAVEIFGLTIQDGDRFTGTFIADSDDFQGTGADDVTVTDFTLTIGDTQFNYPSLDLGVVFTNSVLEAIQTGDEVAASGGPFPANMAFVAAGQIAAFAQFLPGPPIPNIPVLDAIYTITEVPEPITEFVSFSDPVGDHLGNIDLVRMEFRFDSGIGDYEVTYFASPADPFVGRFQLSTALFNPDAGVDGSYVTFLSEAFDLVTPVTAISDSGRHPGLFAWAVGDRVAASGPDPLGVPPGVPEFASGVLEPVSLGVDRFSNASGIVTLPEPTTALLYACALVTLALLRRRAA
jgi:hypothetical protein